MKTYIYCDRIEKLCSQLLILPVYQDERPLTSLSSKIDWRLCGKLSALLAQNIVTGTASEGVIFAPRNKLFIDRIFLCGIGTRRELNDAEINFIFENIFRRVKSMIVQDYTISISQFITGKMQYEDVAGRMIRIIAKIKKDSPKFPETQYIVVNGRDELLKLANCLKKLDRNIPIDMSIEVVSP